MPYAHNQFACSADCLHSVLHRRDSILAHFACARLQVDKRQTRAGAVIAVAIFGQEAPDYFGVFDVAFLTLFYVTAGEPWPDELQRLNPDGSANWITGGFTLAFTIVVHLIVLEVIFLKRTLWFDCAGRGNGWWRHFFWTCLLSELYSYVQIDGLASFLRGLLTFLNFCFRFPLRCCWTTSLQPRREWSTKLGWRWRRRSSASSRWRTRSSPSSSSLPASSATVRTYPTASTHSTRCDCCCVCECWLCAVANSPVEKNLDVEGFYLL